MEFQARSAERTPVKRAARTMRADGSSSRPPSGLEPVRPLTNAGPARLPFRCAGVNHSLRACQSEIEMSPPATGVTCRRHMPGTERIGWSVRRMLGAGWLLILSGAAVAGQAGPTFSTESDLV